MIDRNLIRPAVHRLINLVGGPVIIPVPSGETWIITNFEPHTPTWPDNAVLAIGEKIMFWGPHNTPFTPFEQIEQVESLLKSKLWPSLYSPQLPIIADGGQNIVVYSLTGTGTLDLTWTVVDKAKGYDRFSAGGRDARRRMIFTWGDHLISLTNGTTTDVFVDRSMNPPGQTTFPWENPVGPDRRYHLIAFIQPRTQQLGVAGVMVGCRVVHEGRDLLTQPLINTLPIDMIDFSTPAHENLITVFPEPYGIDSNEILQVVYRVTMGGAVPQNVTMVCGFLCIEEFLSNDAD